MKEAGAKVVDRLYSENESRIDYIVSSPQFESHIYERAASLQIPFVTVEWVIQSLINRRKARYNALEEYYCFDEQEPSVTSKSPKK